MWSQLHTVKLSPARSSFPASRDNGIRVMQAEARAAYLPENWFPGETARTRLRRQVRAGAKAGQIPQALWPWEAVAFALLGAASLAVIVLALVLPFMP